MTVGLDTSVTLRLLVGEPAAQAAAAWDALAQAAAPVTVSDLVVGETYFALRHHSGVTRHDAITALRGLVSDRKVRATGVAGGVLAQIPDREAGPGLMDRLIVADCVQDGAELLTFDRAAARLPGARLLTV